MQRHVVWAARRASLLVAMRVLLTGATGFVGGAILDRLLEAGHEVIAAVRQPQTRPARAGLRYEEFDFMLSPEPGKVIELVRGADVLINAVGIIRETRTSSFQRMHTDTPLALFAAAQTVGVRRIIQISAAATTEESPFEYFRSKAKADNYLLSKCSVPAVILRPSLIFGERGEATALFRRLAALPVVPLPAGGNFSFRPILVEDVAALVLEALEIEPVPTRPIEVGGADELSLKELLLTIRATGFDSDRSRGATVSIPKLLMKPAAWFGDLTGAGPLNSEMLEMLVMSEAPNLDMMHRAFKFRPRGLASFLRQSTS